MKILIASDIHGSATYCEKLLSAFYNESPDKLLLLGDILYHGPRNDLPEGYSPKDVAAMLNPIKQSVISVRGNCDSEVDQVMLSFPILADYALILSGGRTIFATHGHLYNEETPPPLRDGDILLTGHTHVPKCTEHDSYLYVNPGSVSIPKEGSRHSFILLSDGLLSWKDLAGNTYHEHII